MIKTWPWKEVFNIFACNIRFIIWRIPAVPVAILRLDALKSRTVSVIAHQTKTEMGSTEYYQVYAVHLIDPVEFNADK